MPVNQTHQPYSLGRDLLTVSEFGAASTVMGLLCTRRVSNSKALVIAATSFAALTTSWQLYRHVSLADVSPAQRLKALHEIKKEQAATESKVRNVALNSLGFADPKQPLADLSPNQLDEVAHINWKRYPKNTAASRFFAGVKLREVIGEGKKLELPVLGPLARLIESRREKQGEAEDESTLIEDLDKSARQMYQDWVADPAANFCVEQGFEMTELAWGMLAEGLSRFGATSLLDSIAKQQEDRELLTKATDTAETLVQDYARSKTVDFKQKARQELSERITTGTYPIVVELLRDLAMSAVVQGLGERNILGALAPVLAGGVEQKPYELAARSCAGGAMMAFPRHRKLITVGLRASLCLLNVAESYLRVKREDAIFDLMTKTKIKVALTEEEKKVARSARHLLFGTGDPFDEEDDDEEETLGMLLSGSPDEALIDDEYAYSPIIDGCGVGMQACYERPLSAPQEPGHVEGLGLVLSSDEDEWMAGDQMAGCVDWSFKPEM